MSTSLAQQLKKLAVPESTAFKEDKKKASLLFDPKVAASLDRETFFEIGLSGFAELKKINPSFAVFENSLFNISSKDFERSVQTKDANNRLDKTIRSFLMKLSPYFLLQPAHKALEWLINRFQIHKYNKEDIFVLILPYHETKIFIRFLQIIRLGSSTDTWNWLQPLQKPGIPLAKPILFKKCVSDVGVLKFICDMTIKTVEEFGENAEVLTTLYAFYCSTIVGALEYSNVVSEPFLSVILPGLLECLSSPIADLKSAGYIIVGQLVTKTQLKKKLINHLVNKIVLYSTDLHYEAILLLHLIFDTQHNVTSVSRKAFINFTPHHMKMLCSNINVMISNGVEPTKFLLAFLNGILPLIQTDVENFKIYSTLPDIIISEINFTAVTAEKIIKCAIDCYSMHLKNSENDTDIEILDDSIEENLSDIQKWYSTTIKNLEVKYPSQFDKIVKSEMKSNQLSEEKIKALNDILGFAPKVMQKLGDTYLFEKLYHHNSDMRIEAVNFLIENYKKLFKADKNFLTESINDRLTDDCPDVVCAMLGLEVDKFGQLFSEEIFMKHLLNIVKKGHMKPEWRTSSFRALEIICSLDTDIDQIGCLYVIPYLFPLRKKDIHIAVKISKSHLGKKILSLENDINSSIEDPNDICEIVFNAIQNSPWLPKSSYTSEILKTLPSDEYLLGMFTLLLISFDLKKCRTPIENHTVLENVATYMKSVNLLEIKNIKVTAKSMRPFIKSSLQSTFPTNCFSYFCEEIINNTNCEMSSNLWIDMSNKSLDTNFILCVYETLLDDHLQQFSLLKLLFQKYFSSTQEKIEFFANFVINYIVLAPEKKSLKIRSIKILETLFQHAENVSWVYDSNLLITLLLIGLNSSEFHVRNLFLQIIGILLEKSDNKKNHHIHKFLNELLTRKEEIELDRNQLPLIIGALLTPASITSLTKALQKSMKEALSTFIRIILDSTVPYYIKYNLMLILGKINSEEAVLSFSKVALEILEIVKTGHTIDTYQSYLLSYIIGLGNSLSTSKCLQNTSLWQLIEKALSCKDTISYENDEQHHICVLMLQQIDEPLFKLFSPNHAQSVIELVLNSATFDSNPSIIAAASKMIRKIELSSEHFMSIFKAMENVTDEDTNKKKKRTSTPSLSILNTKEWRLGVTLLEYIQSKKKLSGFEEMLPSLFRILKKCLDFEDQSTVEYSKQLLLTSILNCCQKIDFINKKISLKDTIDIELVILCIRGTQNPQTHHHALMLLAQIADIFPNQVLQYMMAIFTFIGSSVLRQDDAYSFQIITKIIETIIPIIVKFNIDDMNDQELSELECRIIPVLRIFVDAVLDIPEHRRLPLFTKLLQTLSPDHFIWIFLAILFESHIIHGVEENNTNERKRKSHNKEEPVKRLDFAMSLIFEFSPETIMKNFVKLIMYLKSLPEDKPEGESVPNEKPEVIFSIGRHSSKHLRHFKYTIVTFLNNVLSSPVFIQNVSSHADQDVMEDLYKTFIVNTLTYIQTVSKITDKNIGKPQAKYWKVMLHHCYEVLDNTNNLLSVEMFLTVIKGLMLHNLSTVKRKAMEILNNKLSHNPGFFNECDKEILFSILKPIMTIVTEIGENELPEGFSKQELELNQQTALLSLKLLVRLLSQNETDRFKPILNTITDLVKCDQISGNLTASIVLCLAELCSNLKANALSNLPKFMPHLINILKVHTESDASELVLLSVITAVYKIVDTIPLFLSPYLVKLLYHLSVLSAKWNNKSGTKTSVICNKLTTIKVKISSTIPPRVLIPIISQCYDLLLKKRNFDAIGPAMNILADSFADVTGPEFSSLQHDLTNFFLSALQFRNDHTDDSSISDKQIDQIEEYIIKALVALVLKLSESSFRPLYFKIYDWSVRDCVGNNKERAITFYRLSSYIADGLRGLFILFAGHFVKNSVDLLDACNKNKTDVPYFPSEDKCCLLIEYIVKTLTAVFLHDTQNFVNKDKFETMMQPLVDQLDNTIGGIESLTARATNLIIPCISQFAIATADDSLWKPLNYQILLKTRHNDSAIRLLGLECMREMALKLGDSWLPLLPESVPFLAELLEDEVPEVEAATQKSVQTLETVLGEPLQKYF